MKRKMASLYLISLPLLLLTLFLHLSAAAAPGQQDTPDAEPTPAPATQQAIRIRQQIPLTFTLAPGSSLTDTEASNLLGALLSSIDQADAQTGTVGLQTLGLTLTLDLQLTVTDTLTSTLTSTLASGVTSTVPATVTLTWGEQQTSTIPISITLGTLPYADVLITRVLSTPITSTVGITDTDTITPSTEVTETTELTPSTDITGTLPFTVNLRSGPDTTFDALGSLPGGQTVTIAARNADSTWYLLDNGLWVAAFLVENVQGDLPLATDELVESLRGQATITTTTTATTTTPITPTAPLTETGVVTETTAPTTTSPTLVPTPAAPQPTPAPSVTVNANLRSGPGTTFPVVAGTVAGQAITIIARNADSTWFQLDNQNWVSASLVANPPALDTIPVFSEATATPTPAPTGTVVTTTTVTTTTTSLGVRENLYVIRVDGLVNAYDLTLDTIDGLVNQASANEVLLQDPAWIEEMNAAIALLRATGDEVTALTPPALFATPHADLVEAAASFTDAADLLAEGIDALDIDSLDEAFATITTGTALLTRAENGVEELTP